MRADPTANLSDVNDFLDTSNTCQRSDQNKTLFLGSLSPFSNLYQTKLVIDNVSYSCVEQYIQSEKAAMFDNDIAHYKIMAEQNPYRIK